MSTVQMQIRLAPTVAGKFEDLTPRWKRRAVAALLTCAVEGVDVHALLASVDQVRRVGVNVDQLAEQSHIARKKGLPYFDALTMARVNEYLDFLERIRGRA